MARIPLWKRSIRRGFKHARLHPRNTGIELALELSAMAITRLHEHLAAGEDLTEEELSRRVSEHHRQRAIIERRMAETWKHVMVEDDE